MRRYGIHLNALRAFEAAARLSSFSRAGNELNVSHSTISHHIKGLEQELGVKLFHRENRQVALTAEAEKLFHVLQKSFDEISTALEAFPNNRRLEALKVTVTPSFANKWLIPHLRWFRTAHPEIEVQVKPSLKLNDFASEKLDVGVRTGFGKWQGLKSQHLMSVTMTPLCSRSYLEERGGEITLDTICESTLIHADVIPGTGIESEWLEWLSIAKISHVEPQKNLSVQDPGLALLAAKDGLGIAMGYLELAAAEIAKGELIQPFPIVAAHPWSYYVVTPENNVGDTRVNTFCEWLKREVDKQLLSMND